jgi:putative ABC transport system permease protein
LSSSPILRNRRAHLFTVIARLRDGTSIGEATQELGAVSRHILDDSKAIDPNLSLVLSSLQGRLVQSVRPALLALWGAVGLLLVIGAANIANLLLMLGSARLKELSIRTALGARRARLVRQLVTESLVLGMCGGLAGTLLGVWGVPVLKAALPQTLPRAADVAADTTVIGFAVGLSLLTALVFGLIPALRVSADQAGDALRDRHGDGRTQSRLRGALVAIEVALAVLLLVGAGLLARSFASVLGVRVGFDPQQTVAFDLSLPAVKYPDARAHAAFLDSVVERIVPLPGVSAVGVTGALVMSGTPATTMEPEATPVRDALSADIVTASPGFFSALRIPLRRGRLFTASDRHRGAPVMLLNETAVKTFWPDGTEPIGRRITMRDWGTPYVAEVVGVVGDVHQSGPDVPVQPAAYYPVAQFPETLIRNSVVIRATGDPLAVVAAAREQVQALDPELPSASIRTMDQILSGAVSVRRFNLILLAAFSIAAMLLAGIGIYGVVAFAVAQRTREIGVRIALGALPVDVARLTIAQGARPVGIGLLLGLAGAALVSRALEGLLYGVTPGDPATLGGVSLLVLSIGLAACAIPARRALRIDPARALRSE